MFVEVGSPPPYVHHHHPFDILLPTWCTELGKDISTTQGSLPFSLGEIFLPSLPFFSLKVNSIPALSHSLYPKHFTGLFHWSWVFKNILNGH